MKKRLALLLAGVCLGFLAPCSTAYASDIIHTTALEVYQEDEEIPLDVIIAADIIGEEYNICPELLEAIAYCESRCTLDAKNGKCVGIMQINYPYYKDRLLKLNLTNDDLYDLYANMKLAADFLADLFAEYSDPTIVLSYYHGEKTHSVTNPSKYVKNILKHSEELEERHGKKQCYK